MSNGLGPWWFPSWLRDFISNRMSFFFDKASWTKHDEGYSKGYPSRSTCDRKFLMAMLEDVSKQDIVWKMAISTLFAWLFWLLVRVFGWLSYSHSKGDKYKEQ